MVVLDHHEGMELLLDKWGGNVVCETRNTMVDKLVEKDKYNDKQERDVNLVRAMASERSCERVK